MKILEYELIKKGFGKWKSQPLVAKRIEVFFALIGFGYVMLIDVGTYSYIPIIGYVMFIAIWVGMAGFILWLLWQMAYFIIRELNL